MGPTSLFDKGCPTTSFDELVVVDARAAKAPRKEARTDVFLRRERPFGGKRPERVPVLKRRAHRLKNSQIHKKVKKKKNFYAFFLTFGLLSKMCSTFPALKCLTLKNYWYEYNRTDSDFRGCANPYRLG